MFYQIKSYIKFIFRSTNAHGVHSPFVYDLITQCFNDSTNHNEYSILKNYRNQLIQSQESIDVTDFGQGSRVFKSDTRKVSAIAKNAGITAKRQQLLFRFALYFNSKIVLELGTSLGLATSALSLANPKSKIHTIEGCPNTASEAAKMFKKFNLTNINLHSTTFESYLSENKFEKYDLVFIDGNHNKNKTLEYFTALLKQSTDDTVLIFDDIYWSPQMTEAWNEIKSHPNVTVSIDTFHWGMLFLRKEQAKEHFNIRL